MKKTFKFNIEGKKSERVRDAIRHEVKKYIKRERNKTLPTDMDFWAFNCKCGANEDSAETLKTSEISAKIEEIAATGADSCYIEILAYADNKPEPQYIDEDEED